MIILGLTGSIGMGKSTCAAMLRQCGVPVHDADGCVHELLSHDQATIKKILRCFPQLSAPLDRKKLGAIVFSDPKARKDLEAILHPRVRADQDQFLRRMRAKRFKIAALDIPLLFETGAQSRVDYVAVVDAPATIQAQRVLARANMSADKFRAILAQQMPSAQKCQRADFILPSGLGRAYTMRCVRAMLHALRSQ